MRSFGPTRGEPSGVTMQSVQGSPLSDHRIRVTRRRFPCALESVAAIRRFVTRSLRREPEARIAVLLASELAANGIVHAGSDIVVTVVGGLDATYVAVYDTGPGAPRLMDPTPDTASGRGILLVDALADAWGVQTHDGGKSVWFVLRRSIAGMATGQARWQSLPGTHDGTRSI